MSLFLPDPSRAPSNLPQSYHATVREFTALIIWGKTTPDHCKKMLQKCTTPLLNNFCFKILLHSWLKESEHMYVYNQLHSTANAILSLWSSTCWHVNQGISHISNASYEQFALLKHSTVYLHSLCAKPKKNPTKNNPNKLLFSLLPASVPWIFQTSMAWS